MQNYDDWSIRTSRLVIRPTSVADLDEIWPHVSDPEISRNMSWEPHQTKEETIAFLHRMESERKLGKNITWSIRNSETSVFCGIFSVISIVRQHRALTYDRGELAYWCGRAQQGQGFMSEAGKAVIEFAFTTLNLNRLVVAHHSENNPSKRLILKLGFTKIGVEHEAFQKSGRWIDTTIYELLKNSWVRNR
jgi:[ribosomal protein S5]-alanine N-acetyltransferase